MQTFGAINISLVGNTTVYANTSSSVASPAGDVFDFKNSSTTVNGVFGGITLQAPDSGGHANTWYLGATSSATLYGGSFVFGSRTGGTSYNEWGNIAIGTSVDTGVLTIGPIFGNGQISATGGYRDTSIGMTTAAMSSQSSASCTNITNMTWNMAASKNYKLDCTVPITWAASATVAFCLGGPGTATSYSLNADGPIGAAGIYGQINTLAQTAWGGKTTASGAVAGTSVVHVWAGIQNGTTASGTALTLQTAANGTNNITVLANAQCTLTETN